MENNQIISYKQKYLKYKMKYIQLKTQIGGDLLSEICGIWETWGAVTQSKHQDGWFLSPTPRKDNDTHIHLYSDGSYTYKIFGSHHPSIDVNGDDCNYYSIYIDHESDADGCRLFEPTIMEAEPPHFASEWVNFMYNNLQELIKLNSEDSESSGSDMDTDE